MPLDYENDSVFVPMRFFEGWYEINGKGEVRNRKGTRVHPKPDPTKSGNLYVDLSMNGKKFHRKLRNLVFFTFFDTEGIEIPAGEEIAHLDGNRLNCHMDNLVMRPMKRENGLARIEEARALGKPKYSSANIMGDFSQKMTIERARELRHDAKNGMTKEELSTKYGIHRTTVAKILQNKLWKEKE